MSDGLNKIRVVSLKEASNIDKKKVAYFTLTDGSIAVIKKDDQDLTQNINSTQKEDYLNIKRNSNENNNEFININQEREYNNNYYEPNMQNNDNSNINNYNTTNETNQDFEDVNNNQINYRRQYPNLTEQNLNNYQIQEYLYQNQMYNEPNMSGTNQYYNENIQQNNNMGYNDKYANFNNNDYNNEYINNDYNNEYINNDYNDTMNNKVNSNNYNHMNYADNSYKNNYKNYNNDNNYNNTNPNFLYKVNTNSYNNRNYNNNNPYTLYRFKSNNYNSSNNIQKVRYNNEYPDSRQKQQFRNYNLKYSKSNKQLRVGNNPLLRNYKYQLVELIPVKLCDDYDSKIRNISNPKPQFVQPYINPELIISEIKFNNNKNVKLSNIDFARDNNNPNIFHKQTTDSFNDFDNLEECDEQGNFRNELQNDELYKNVDLKYSDISLEQNKLKSQNKKGQKYIRPFTKVDISNKKELNGVNLKRKQNSELSNHKLTTSYGAKGKK